MESYCQYCDSYCRETKKCAKTNEFVRRKGTCGKFQLSPITFVRGKYHIHTGSAERAEHIINIMEFANSIRSSAMERGIMPW